MKVLLDNNAMMPKAPRGGDAGIGILSPVPFEVKWNGCTIVHTGVHVEIPAGHVGLIFPPSGFARRLLTSSGRVIPEGDLGAISVVLHNGSEKMIMFERGDKIAQLVIVPVADVTTEQVDEWGDTTEETDDDS